MKINYYEESKWGRYHEIHELKLGENININLADTYGIMREFADFRLRIEYANIIYK